MLASDNNSRLTLANAIDFGATPRTVHLDVSNFAELTGAIRGSGGLVKTGMGHLYISGVNEMTGPMVVNGGQLHVNAMGNGGIAGPLGNTSSAASNIVLGSGAETCSGGRLSYHSDTNSSTDRLFTLRRCGHHRQRWHRRDSLDEYRRGGFHPHRTGVLRATWSQ